MKYSPKDYNCEKIEYQGDSIYDAIGNSGTFYRVSKASKYWFIDHVSRSDRNTLKACLEYIRDLEAPDTTELTNLIAENKELDRQNRDKMAALTVVRERLERREKDIGELTEHSAYLEGQVLETAKGIDELTRINNQRSGRISFLESCKEELKKELELNKVDIAMVETLRNSISDRVAQVRKLETACSNYKSDIAALESRLAIYEQMVRIIERLENE